VISRVFSIASLHILIVNEHISIIY